MRRRRRRWDGVNATRISGRLSAARCRSRPTTASRTAGRSRSRSCACRPATRRGGSAPCSLTPGAPAGGGGGFPLFLNPGGPGGSGVDFTLFAGPALFTPEVRARFDLVGFDPRGVLRSSALRCFGTPKQWHASLTPFAFPSTAAEEATWITSDRYLTAACPQRGGKIVEHMAT